MTEQEKRSLISEFAAAWARADVDALMNMMTDDCVFGASVGPEPGTTFRGREMVRDGFIELLEFEAGGEQHVGNLWILDDHAFGEWSYDQTDDAGNVFNIRGFDVFRFSSGRIQQKDAYRKTTY